TANPEDYTNRGAIVTPLKDRIESQILTHYPTSLETSLSITEQEADLHADQVKKINISDLVKRLIEQVSFEARASEYVDKKSGVSARLTIAAFENAVSAAERRAIMNKEKETQVWISDLVGIIPSITGKIELVYEGEQEGPYQVAYNLMEKAIRTQFAKYFPNPETSKKKRAKESVADENPYKAITRWFDTGNHLNLFFGIKDEDKIQLLYKVDGLYGIVKKHFPNANAKENALLMEFVLHGLSTYSLISKKVVEGRIEFKDLMGSMLNMSTQSFSDDELDDEDFK
ncbi:MAG: magnesium chelatase, partial [Chitinophagaceae bacterium]